MSEFKIEKGIPLPRRSAANKKYDFGAMKIGDSMLCAGVEPKEVRGVAHAAGKREGMKFATRTVEGGVRVWRIA